MSVGQEHDFHREPADATNAEIKLLGTSLPCTDWWLMNLMRKSICVMRQVNKRLQQTTLSKQPNSYYRLYSVLGIVTSAIITSPAARELQTGDE